MRIVKSPLKSKKYRALFEDGTHTDFGASGYLDFTMTGDDAKRQAYIKRHRVNENWNDYKSAGTLSRFILWGDSKDIQKNIVAYKKKFGL
jgi:hypothetical protein